MKTFLTLMALLSATVHAQTTSYTYSKGQDVKAIIHPYARSGDIGRATGMFHNYRPEFRPGGKHPGITCQLVLSPKDHIIEPGSTEGATLICDESVTLMGKEQKYTILEGGRLVGEATFVWPTPIQQP